MNAVVQVTNVMQHTSTSLSRSTSYVLRIIRSNVTAPHRHLSSASSIELRPGLVVVLGDNDTYSYVLSQCGISVGDDYSLQWHVIGKRVYFELHISGVPVGEDFWIGIGVSKIQVNSPVDESEVLAILRLQEVTSLEIFDVKSGKIESAQSLSQEDEQTLSYAYNSPTSLSANFSRPLRADHFFNNSINDCAIWTFYTKPVLMNETFVDPALDALICNVSALCSPYSIDNFPNALLVPNRHRRQTVSMGSTQANLTNNPNIPGLYNPVVNPQSPNYTAVLRQNQQALSRYQDPSCTLPDPYWCSNFVQQYISWQQKYNNIPLQAACAPLRASVANADNRCCQAVRAIGC